MEPLQIFKVVMKFLAQRSATNPDVPSLLETGVLMCPREQLATATAIPTAEELTELRGLFDVLVMECISELNNTVRCNIFARVSKQSVMELVWEARCVDIVVVSSTFCISSFFVLSLSF